MYLIAGVIYNRYRREKRGVELIPNLDLWVSLPSLVKDGHIYLYKRVMSLRGRTYEQVS